MVNTYTVALTGASGAAYGARLLGVLLERGCDVRVVLSDTGRLILREEMGIDLDRTDLAGALEERFGERIRAGRLMPYRNDDFTAPMASGSSASDAMIVVPCSMKTLSGIASGASLDLIQRTADVMMKERRPLVLVPRETPLNAIQIENMLLLARLGVHIVPAMPAFYQRPERIDDLVDFMVGKVLSVLGIEHDLFRSWGAGEG